MPKPKLTKKERGALLAVRDMLQNEVIKHQPFARFMSSACAVAVKRLASPFFNMAVVMEDRECGSAGCIGGWMGHFMGIESVMQRKKFAVLFFPNEDRDEDADAKIKNRRCWGSIKPKEAAKAIDNFLKTGNPKWDRKISAWL